MEQKKNSGRLKSLDDQEKLLKLIEKGDAFSLLSEENLGEGINELIKNELVSIVDGKIELTELGNEVKNLGISEVILRNKAISTAVTLPIKPSKNNNNIYLYLLLILTLLIFAFLAITMMISLSSPRA